MSEPTLSQEDTSPKSEMGVPTYLAVFAALILCTLLSVGSSFINLGDGNAAFVLLIAVIKAFLTVLFFMHVRYSSRLVMMTVVAGIFTLGVLFVMSLSDYMSRAWGSW